jgi:hypothetical protein
MSEIIELITTNPNVIWWIALVGAVCVIGVTEFCKCWTKNKKSATKWIVLFVSLVVSIILSPIVPPIVAIIVIPWLLILALAIIGYKAIVDGIPALVSKLMGNIRPIEGVK